MNAHIDPDWEDMSDNYGASKPGVALLTRLTIYGTAHHLTALRVKEEDGIQMAEDEACQSDLERVYELYDYRFETTHIPGYEGEFILYATPYGD